LEVLREPEDSRYVFYALVVVMLLATIRPWSRLLVLLVATAALGFAAHEVAGAISDRAVDGVANGGSRLADWVANWVIVPVEPASWITPVSYISLIVLLLVLTLLDGWWRIALLVPTLYLAAFVWENVMAAKPEPTRYIVLGAILVATMVARPSGILGERRVEIV
ncbi:MAG TPA: hypothetical protein VFR43_14070, partial [Gaiellaceae bacterium]|nr:hypothetical protein [Gaiellaceae bacterium]